MSLTSRPSPDGAAAATASAPRVAPRTPPRTGAAWAAAGYVAIFVLAVFANFMAVGAVLDPRDAAGTTADLAAAETTFRAGVLAFLAIFLVDLVVAWALHVLLRGVHADLSLLAAWARLVYTVFLGVSLVFLHAALLLADGRVGGVEVDPEPAVLLALQAFDFTWVVGLACFGVHLALLGALLLRAAGAPRLLGVLLPVAGLAYAADTVARIVLSDYDAVAGVFLAVVAVPSVVAELGLTVWLVLVATGRRPVPRAR